MFRLLFGQLFQQFSVQKKLLVERFESLEIWLLFFFFFNSVSVIYMASFAHYRVSFWKIPKWLHLLKQIEICKLALFFWNRNRRDSRIVKKIFAVLFQSDQTTIWRSTLNSPLTPTVERAQLQHWWLIDYVSIERGWEQFYATVYSCQILPQQWHLAML